MMEHDRTTIAAKMRIRLLTAIPVAAVVVAACLCGALNAAPSVWTEHNDNGRTGQNLSETILTPSNVNQTSFGKLWTATLDDEAYSQPLYVPSLTIGGVVHNVVYDTSVNDSVYAFDADTGALLWHDNLLISGDSVPSNAQASSWGACSGAYTDFVGKFGIVGTPVINTSTNTMYVVARSYTGSTYIQQLHALNITTGAEMSGSPVTISGSYNGSSFSAQLNNQRPALALINGVVYIMWSSHCDFGAYHGFIIGYNASTLAQSYVWADTSNGGTQGGIWQGGQGATADASNNLYVMTGNGTWDGSSNFGESFVKLSPSLGVLDYFTPSNWSTLNGGDTDLGSAGDLGIPGTSYVFGGGKQGMVYLVNTANMGHENGTDQVVQEFQATSIKNGGSTNHIHGGPVYFNNGSNQYVYLWGENDYMHCFQFNGSSFNSTAVANSTMLSPVSSTGMPGGFLSVSANGTSNGIVWALEPYNGDANHGTVQGILHAFTATPNGTTMTELWNSKQNTSRDDFGNYSKDSYPTISNGKVYVSTFGSASSGSGTLVAYGELTTGPPTTPTGVANAAENSKILVYWPTVTGATAYNVYWATSSGGEGSTPILSGTTYSSFENTGLTNGTKYYYKVAAVNAAGTSAQSSEVSATPTTTNGPVANGTYTFTPQCATGSHLDANASGTTNGTKVQIWTSGTGTNQQWIVTNEGGGLYKIQPSYDTALALDISGAGTTSGTIVQLYTDNSTDSQRWTATASSFFPGSYVFSPIYASGMAMDVTGASNVNGTQVEIYTANNTNAQAWTLGSTGTSCTASPGAPSGLTASGTTSTSTNLSWSTVTPPANCTVSSYTVYSNGTSIGTATGTTFSATGLSPSTTYSFTVAATDSFGTSGQSGAVNVTTSPSSGGGGIKIACGNSAQGSFVADTDFSGGANSSGTTSAINTANVYLPAPTAVYQHGRKSTCTYTIPNLTAGATYNVRLDFCEYAATAAGQRTFNVSINGNAVLTNFDIFAAAGGEFIANAQSFTATANSSGQIVLAFTTVLNNVLVAGIEIAGSDVQPTVALHTLAPQNINTSRLDDPGSATANGSKIDISASTGTANQQWNFGSASVAPAGDWNLAVNLGAYCLDATTAGAGTQATIWACSGTRSQSWQTLQSSGNIYYVESAVNGYCLDVSGNGTANGTAVITWQCNGQTNQQWAIQ